MSEESQNAIEILKLWPIAISVGALVISIISLAWNFILERQRKKAKLQVWQRNDYSIGSGDDRPRINLVVRNMSHRPTAVLDIYLRNNDGGVIKNVGEKDKVHLPIKIGKWDVQIISFRVDSHEENKIRNILLRDIDDNEIVVIRGKGKTWHG